VAVPFAEIAERFERVFSFIRGDLERILTLKSGVNYAAASLIACACETLAKYRYGTREGTDSFVKMLPDGPLQAVGKTIYNARRNGLVHGYDAQDIRFDEIQVELGIAWKEGKHLTVTKREGKIALILNVHQLCTDLLSAFDEYRAELQASVEARDNFVVWHRQGRLTEVRSPEEVRAWKALVEEKLGS
jgi:hypothetical protein